MRRIFSRKAKRGKDKKTRQRKNLLNICIITVCAGLIVFGVWRIFIYESEDIVARREYAELREVFFQTPEAPEPSPLPEQAAELPEETEDDIEEEEHLNLDELARINPDFIGWISIENHIEYPVVRGTNNDKYMYTTFSGDRNSAGSIFMDFRNRNGFDDHIAILFGHRTRDGTMFSPLLNYLDRTFLQENPVILITTRDGEELTYRIFAARQTDAWDSAYEMSFSNSIQAASAFPNAPADATRFLLLSTCTASNDRDERVIVFAALEG